MSGYLNRIQLHEHDDYVSGGLPIGNMIDKVMGGKTNEDTEGSIKIQHLSIPLGLVLVPINSMLHLPKLEGCKTISKNTDSDVLDEGLFEKMWRTTTLIRGKRQYTRKKSMNI